MANTLALTADFIAASEADWRALVDKTLGEAPFATLEKATAEGLPIAPLYAPARQPVARARAVPADRAWEVATFTAHPDPSRANAEILADLERRRRRGDLASRSQRQGGDRGGLCRRARPGA